MVKEQSSREKFDQKLEKLLEEVQAVEAWNRDLKNWNENLFVEGNAWKQELNAYVAAWKYDPETMMNRMGKAYMDWILSSHGISPRILESDNK